jgi:hypothetical protein
MREIKPMPERTERARIATPLIRPADESIARRYAEIPKYSARKKSTGLEYRTDNYEENKKRRLPEIALPARAHYLSTAAQSFSYQVSASGNYAATFNGGNVRNYTRCFDFSNLAYNQRNNTGLPYKNSGEAKPAVHAVNGSTIKSSSSLSSSAGKAGR